MKAAYYQAFCFICILSYTVGCRNPQPATEWRAEAVSALREETGSPPGRIRTWFRGSNRVLAEYASPGGSLYCRVFYHNGQRAMAESDEDGDGFFETVTLFGAGAELPFEVFVRSKNGTVRPLDSSALKDLFGKVHQRATELRGLFRDTPDKGQKGHQAGDITGHDVKETLK